MTLSDVVTASETIAVGTVTDITETWDAEQETPFTKVTFSVLEVLKGEVAGAELALSFLGGPRPDGSTLVVTGTPEFAVGDRAVVFSDANGLQACPLVGCWQGFYRLFYDLGKGVFTVADHAGQAVVDIDGNPVGMEVRVSTRPNHETVVDDALTLGAFRTYVTRAVSTATTSTVSTTYGADWRTTGGAPDLVVRSLRTNPGTLTAGATFTLSATVRNIGSGTAAATTLRYYHWRSSSREWVVVGSDSVGQLSASASSPESIRLAAPSHAGTAFSTHASAPWRGRPTGRTAPAACG